MQGISRPTAPVRPLGLRGRVRRLGSPGPVRRLGLPDSVSGVLSIHPDGRQFAYEMGDRQEEVWVLENFLPAAKAAQK